jgi:uncharacterized protein YkwD
MRTVRLTAVCSLLAFAVLLVTPLQAPAAGGGSSRMIHQINKVRARYGLQHLRASSSLSHSSAGFSRQLMSGGRFGHDARIHASRRFRRLGEALAMHGGLGLGISDTVRRWLGSPTHRPIVLTRTMRYVGAGLARGRFQGNWSTIWVLQVGG